jgi:hypothetical protein
MSLPCVLPNWAVGEIRCPILSLYTKEALHALDLEAIMKLGVNIETNCVALTPCMNVSYVVHHKAMASLLSQCIMSSAYWHFEEMWSVLQHIKDTVRDSLFMHIICWIWFSKWALMHHFTCRPGKDYRRKRKNVRGWKLILHMRFRKYWGKSLTGVFFFMFFFYESGQMKVLVFLFFLHVSPQVTKSANHEKETLVKQVRFCEVVGVDARKSSLILRIKVP